MPAHRDADPAVLARLPARPGTGDASAGAAHALGDHAESEIAVGGFALGQPSLDQVFLALTGLAAAPGRRSTGDSMTGAPATDRRAASLLSGARPGPAGPVAESLAFAWRSLLKIKHVPEQLGDVIGIPIVFTLRFTYLFGGALAGSTGKYLQFLLPGTLALASSSSASTAA